MRPPSVIVYQGKVADHNERAMLAAPLLGETIGSRLRTSRTVVGRPQPVNNHGWANELTSAASELRELATTVDIAWSTGRTPIIALSRNTAALATLPVLARNHPGAVLIWIGADISLHTPATTRTGYLGGMVLAAATGLWDSTHGAGLALSHIALCGTRDIEPVEQLLIDAGVVAHVHRPGDTLTDLDRAIAGRPIFIHFACDALEPGTVPTDYRIPNGYTLDEVAALIHALTNHEVLGIEITELEAPISGSAEKYVELVADLLWPLIARFTATESSSGYAET